MPELCRFRGIIIRIHPNDHEPPHFHAVYGDEDDLIEIGGADGPHVSEGDLPRRARRLVLEWALQRQDELREAWERVRRGEPPGRIAPPE